VVLLASEAEHRPRPQQGVRLAAVVQRAAGGVEQIGVAVHDGEDLGF
jgi:hypothetical protein